MKNSTFPVSDVRNPKLSASPSLSPKELLADYYERLPPAFTRCMIDDLFKGLMSSDTQRNLDCAGLGPASYKSKKKVAYRTKVYLPWLEAYLYERWLDAPGPDEAA